jgi:glycosyltransferase involved in cell wall biosynthesis
VGDCVKRLDICIPFFGKPFPQTLKALEASVPLLRDAGWDVHAQIEVNNPYISSARNIMLRKALDRYADVIVFIDHDVSWDPGDLLALVETPGDVVAGTYRFKKDEVEYMGLAMPDIHGQQQVRWQGPCNDPYDPAFQCAILGHSAPAGFLKVTANAVDRFMRAYPELIYGLAYAPSIDLFNHGVKDNVWWGEDYAFCRNWRDLGGELLLVPNLNISHWRRDEGGGYTEFKGNYHWYLATCAGGARAPERLAQENDDAEQRSGGSGVQRSAA